jgi:hypothetical protein
MKLYELFGSKGFHTCIATTFGVDFGAYESIVLPRLRGAGCFNNMLMADTRMLNYALDGASALPQHAGRHYTVTGVGAAGVFHPKVTLQLGQRTGRLIVASANVTAAGLAGNLELAGYVDCDAENLAERQLLAAAWQYCRGLIGPGQQGQEHQFDWLRPRTPWLFDTEPADGLVSLSDGTHAALLRSGMAESIGARFTALVDEPVRRLIVMSPYWDHDLRALRFLMRALQPRETFVLIDSQTALFPGTTQKRVGDARVHELGKFTNGRFVHGKLIIAETARADHVLYGSANCTVAALGTDRHTGSNEELCLYRCLTRKSVVASLGLTDVLTPANKIEISALPTYAPEDPLPLDAASLRSPGRFECVFDTLLWWPTARGQSGQIELLDAAGEILPATVTPMPNGSEAPRRYRIAGLAAWPAFARLRFTDGSPSAPAIVTAVDRLRETIRDARGRRAEAAALQLADETEEGLWLWEILDELEAAESGENGGERPSSRQDRGRSKGADGPETYRTLDYERFMAGRRLASDLSAATGNSLVGSDLSLVRDFINRILALGGDSKRDKPVDDDALAQGLDLGDETGNAEDALESGSEFSPQTEHESESSAEQERLARKRATRQQIVSAVESFNERIKARAEGGRLTPLDILRFRAILMIVAAAGQPGRGATTPAPLTSLQVLPCDDGAEAWPRLIGRLVFTLFGGNRPAIRHLHIEAIHDGIPGDILECWATALWATQACAAASLQGSVRNMQVILRTLVEQTYARTSLRKAELESGRIAAVFDRLNDRFGERLGLAAPLIKEAHTKTIADLFVAKTGNVSETSEQKRRPAPKSGAS